MNPYYENQNISLSTTERQLLTDFGLEAWSMIAESRAQEAQIEADAYWDRIKALSDRPDEEDWYGVEDVEKCLALL